MKKTYPKLYTQNSDGVSINVWWAEQTDNSYITCYGRVDGKIVKTKPIYCEVKNPGKKNATTPFEQCGKEIGYLYKTQLRKNYFKDINDVDKKILEPQLAKPCADFIDDVIWDDKQIVDWKLNGIASMIHSGAAMSRGNKLFHAIPHILKDLQQIFREYPAAYFQGELFNPKYVKELDKIAKLVSVNRKIEDITPEILEESEKKVQFWIYDGYNFCGLTQDSTQKERRYQLKELFKKFKFKHCKIIPYKICGSFEEMSKFAKDYIATGGEGVIIRNPKTSYVHKRTKNLLKFKKCEDAEFKIIKLEEGSGNWEGCAKAVWCELPEGKRTKKFKANIEGSTKKLKLIWKNRNTYPGKWITVRFQELSSWGVPLIPYTDLLVRDYE